MSTRATVRRGQKGRPLIPIPGAPPDLRGLPAGCAFTPRCPLAREECLARLPVLIAVGPEHDARCHLVPERFGPPASPVPALHSQHAQP